MCGTYVCTELTYFRAFYMYLLPLTTTYYRLLPFTSFYGVLSSTPLYSLFALLLTKYILGSAATHVGLTTKKVHYYSSSLALPSQIHTFETHRIHVVLRLSLNSVSPSLLPPPHTSTETLIFVVSR